MELNLGTAPLSDDAVLQAFEACQLDPSRFHHADHIRLAWLCVRRHGAAKAETLLLDGIRKFAQRAGAPQKFHHTITIAWTRLVAAACSKSNSGESFSEWMESHPELLNKHLLKEHYSEERLEISEARAGWLDPDLKPLSSNR
jgi:hypothetical protein